MYISAVTVVMSRRNSSLELVITKKTRLSNILIRIDNYRKARSSNNTEWIFCKMPKHIEQLREELGLIL